MPITTYPFGTGIIIRHGIGSGGRDWWLCSFPGWGRKFIEPHHIVNNHIFSNN